MITLNYRHLAFAVQYCVIHTDSYNCFCQHVKGFIFSRRWQTLVCHGDPH